MSENFQMRWFCWGCSGLEIGYRGVEKVGEFENGIEIGGKNTPNLQNG